MASPTKAASRNTCTDGPGGKWDCGIAGFFGVRRPVVAAGRRQWCCARQQTANDGSEAAWGFIGLIITPAPRPRGRHGKSTRGLEGPELSRLRQS